MAGNRPEQTFGLSPDTSGLPAIADRETRAVVDHEATRLNPIG